MVARDHSHPSAKSAKGSNRTTTEEPPEETEILAVKLKPTAAGNKKATVVDDKYSYWISSSLFSGALGTSVGSTADLALIRMQADATLHAAQHRN